MKGIFHWRDTLFSFWREHFLPSGGQISFLSLLEGETCFFPFLGGRNTFFPFFERRFFFRFWIFFQGDQEGVFFVDGKIFFQLEGFFLSSWRETFFLLERIFSFVGGIFSLLEFFFFLLEGPPLLQGEFSPHPLLQGEPIFLQVETIFSLLEGFVSAGRIFLSVGFFLVWMDFSFWKFFS